MTKNTLSYTVARYTVRVSYTDGTRVSKRMWGVFHGRALVAYFTTKGAAIQAAVRFNAYNQESK